MEFDKLLAVLRAFHAEAVEYVLVGGAALNLLGLVRATVDVDFFVRPDAANVERIRRALRRVWDDPEINGIVAEDLAGEYAVVRYGPPDETLVVDLIASSYGRMSWTTGRPPICRMAFTRSFQNAKSMVAVPSRHNWRLRAIILPFRHHDGAPPTPARRAP